MTHLRVRIREHTLDDVEPYCEWQMDPHVARYVSWLPRTRAESKASLLDAIAQQSAHPRTRFFFAVALMDSDEMLGDVGYTMTHHGVADCGWFIRKRYWRQGYGAEAVQLLIQHAFDIQGMSLLTSSCAAENRASIRIMESSGFGLVSQSDLRKWYELRR